ncbi:MAG: hypothetical protein ABIS86_03380 [Streptosporangiaceae bacterium]
MPDLGNLRWRRRLIEATGLYQYQRTNTATHAVSAWGTVAALGAPAPPAQLLAVDAATRLVIGGSDEALEAYRWLQALTTTLGGKLLAVKNNVPALVQAAGDHFDNVTHLLITDTDAYRRAAAAATDDDRTRLIRLGVKLLLDAHGSVVGWAQRTAVLGPHQVPLVAVAGRGHDLGDKLLTALH